MSINFFSEDIDFELSPHNAYAQWLSECVRFHSASIENLNYIFCSDAYLLKINQDYLQHDYYTDIISFPYAEHPNPLEGDIFISIDMVKENAEKNGVDFQRELLRVMAHGVLHFLGFKDKTEEESLAMREKEEEMMGRYIHE